MRYRTLLFAGLSSVFFILLFVGCKEKGSTGQQQRTHFDLSEGIELQEIQNTVADTLFLQNSKVIFLENNPSSVLNEVNKIFMDDNKLFVLDKALSKVVVYDISGKYLNHLEAIGNGPREYTGLIDIFVNDSTKQIHLLCDHPFKIMTYDYDMHYINEIKIDDLYLEFIQQGNYFICRRAELENNIPNKFYVDVVDVQTGDIIKSLLPIESNTKRLNKPKIPGSMITKSSSILVSTLDNNFINEFKSQDDVLEKKYDMNRLSSTNGQIVNMVESDSFLIFKTGEGMFLYDKKAKKLKGYKYGILNTADLNAGLSEYLPVGNTINKVAFIYSPSLLKTVEKAFKEKQSSIKDSGKVNRKFLDFASKVKFDDNPILFIYDLN
ncbi:6-bladed beta-propeller [Sinomicrobium sp. M5D2P17]